MATATKIQLVEFNKDEALNSLNHRYVCSECGSPNIQVQAWVNANTNEYVDDITDNAECWCEDCDKHTKLKEV